MEPDKRMIGRQRAGNESPGNAPQALHEPLAVFARGGHAPKPPGRADDEGQEQGEVIEKQSHA